MASGLVNVGVIQRSGQSEEYSKASSATFPFCSTTQQDACLLSQMLSANALCRQLSLDQAVRPIPHATRTCMQTSDMLRTDAAMATPTIDLHSLHQQRVRNWTWLIFCSAVPLSSSDNKQHSSLPKLHMRVCMHSCQVKR